MIKKDEIQDLVRQIEGIIGELEYEIAYTPGHGQELTRKLIFAVSHLEFASQHLTEGMDIL